MPDDPVVHAPGAVGVSSRWWYLPGMYTPVVHGCHCCSGIEASGPKLSRTMTEDNAFVQKTAELYRIPIVSKPGDEAKECITWPRYRQLEFSLNNTSGPSMLELTRGIPSTCNCYLAYECEAGEVWRPAPLQLEKGGSLAGVLSKTGHPCTRKNVWYVL